MLQYRWVAVCFVAVLSMGAVAARAEDPPQGPQQGPGNQDGPGDHPRPMRPGGSGRHGPHDDDGRRNPGGPQNRPQGDGSGQAIQRLEAELRQMREHVVQLEKQLHQAHNGPNNQDGNQGGNRGGPYANRDQNRGDGHGDQRQSMRRGVWGHGPMNRNPGQRWGRRGERFQRDSASRFGHRFQGMGRFGQHQSFGRFDHRGPAMRFGPQSPRGETHGQHGFGPMQRGFNRDGHRPFNQVNPQERERGGQEPRFEGQRRPPFGPGRSGPNAQDNRPGPRGPQGDNRQPQYLDQNDGPRGGMQEHRGLFERFQQFRNWWRGHDNNNAGSDQQRGPGRAGPDPRRPDPRGDDAGPDGRDNRSSPRHERGQDQ